MNNESYVFKENLSLFCLSVVYLFNYLSLFINLFFAFNYLEHIPFLVYFLLIPIILTKFCQYSGTYLVKSILYQRNISYTDMHLLLQWLVSGQNVTSTLTSTISELYDANTINVLPWFGKKTLYGAWNMYYKEDGCVCKSTCQDNSGTTSKDKQGQKLIT